MPNSPHTRSERRSTAELDQLAQDAARLSLVDQLSNTEISSRLVGARGASDIAAQLKRALDRRDPLVAVHVEPLGGARPEVNNTLSTQLAEKTGVRRVLVVKTSLPNGQPPGVSVDEEEPIVLSHGLHRQLAKVAADYLWDHLQDYDLLAVGAGRGVRYTIDELGSFARRRPARYDGIEVMSLAGSGVIRSYPRLLGTIADEIQGWPELEPDEIALALARVLKVDFRRITLVRLPFVLNDPSVVVPEVAPHLLGDDWAHKPPDKAIFGLGVLNWGHHLMVARGSSAIAAIEPMLQHLEREVLSVCATAVIDVYDTFWVREGALPSGLTRVALDIVEELNSKIVAVTRSKINKAREKILVAGSPLKYDGILAYLRQRHEIGVSPTILVTDENTATRLLRDLTEPNSTPSPS